MSNDFINLIKVIDWDKTLEPFTKKFTDASAHITKDYSNKFNRANTLGFLKFNDAIKFGASILESIVAPLSGLNQTIDKELRDANKIVRSAQESNLSLERYLQLSKSAEAMGYKSSDMDYILKAFNNAMDSKNINGIKSLLQNKNNKEAALQEYLEYIRKMPANMKEKRIENDLGISSSGLLKTMIDGSFEETSKAVFNSKEALEKLAATTKELNNKFGQLAFDEVKRNIDFRNSLNNTVTENTLKEVDRNQRVDNYDEIDQIRTYKTANRINTGLAMAGNTFRNLGMGMIRQSVAPAFAAWDMFDFFNNPNSPLLKSLKGIESNTKNNK
ncbi:hypothetical protein Dip510_000057 [Elusimicrobium posterum]|uniref:hypothetical protein n=1 Tax=Elusimicrobium posterum TaxID=3116653 RepID=UPI003C77B198